METLMKVDPAGFFKVARIGYMINDTKAEQKKTRRSQWLSVS